MIARSHRATRQQEFVKSSVEERKGGHSQVRTTFVGAEVSASEGNR